MSKPPPSPHRALALAPPRPPHARAHALTPYRPHLDLALTLPQPQHRPHHTLPQVHSPHTIL